MVPFPNRDGQFLAITEMYLKECPSKQTLVWVKKEKEGWKVQPILHVPFLHRFDIFITFYDII